MSDTPVLQKTQACEGSEKYYSFQIKGWTNADPMTKTLANIAEDIENGSGFITMVEVLRVEGDLSSIEDQEVRECFENTLAARRLVRNIRELPKNLVDELRSALQAEDKEVPRKTAAAVSISSPIDEHLTRVKRWP